MSDESNTLQEEFKLLLRAVRSERPRMVLVQYNHYDLVRRTVQELASTYPDRPMHRFNFSATVLDYLSKTILDCKKGFVLLEHFEQLFLPAHQSQLRTFNQRRDAFFKQPLILILFLPWGLESLKTFQNQLPDVYSIVNPIIQLRQTVEKQTTTFAATQMVDNLDGIYKNVAEAEKDINRLLDRLNNLADMPKNTALKISLQNDLALAYKFVGKYETAAALFQTILQFHINNYGEQHRRTMVSRLNLASVYKNLGRSKEATDLLQAALQSILANDVKQQLDSATNQSDIAMLYHYLGRYEEAADWLQAALQTTTNNYGEQHTSVARTQSNLAEIYRNLGRYKEAHDLLQAALQPALDVYGEEHPTIAIIWSNLALVEQAMGNHQTALQYFSKAYTMLRAQLGNEHPSTKTLSKNLERALKKGVIEGNSFSQEIMKQMMEKK
ncbi:MAG: tetratricopeptide repeat protein [Bacteroidota bacterium]